MPLTKKEKADVEMFAQRHADLVFAMTEGSDRLMGVPQKEVSDLYRRIVAGPHNQMETPELNELESFTQGMKQQVDEFRKGNTPEAAIRMMKAANAGAMMMNSHMVHNHPRLAKAVAIRMTEIHHTAYNKRLKAMGLILPDGHAKIGHHVSLRPIDEFKNYDKDPNLFDPPDAIRDPRKHTRITFDELQSRPFKRIYFAADPDSRSVTAFEILSLKYTAESETVYEVRWEGTSHGMEMKAIELQERVAWGLWLAA